MTLPPQGPPQDPTPPQGRPLGQTPPPGPPPPGPGYPEQPTQQFPGYSQQPTQQFPGYSDQPTQQMPGYAPGHADQATRQIPRQSFPAGPPPADVTAPESEEYGRDRGFFRDPLSIGLSLVIVLALAAAALLGGEFYARRTADSIVAGAVSCVVQDSAKASFGIRPFLLQHFTHSYRDMRVETAGNQIREAKGMKLQLRLDDVRMHQTAESAGTLGSLDADITWSAEGIKQTVSGMIPLIGALVSDVTPNPSAGTLKVEGPLGTVTILPQVDNGNLALQVVQVTGFGFTLPRETAQPALDAFTGQLTKNLPMGIHADSVEVTDSGVAARFVTRNATIPNAQQDPCFAGV
ncbi:LmeA family phospholipid-binding protein [Mycolicibacterium sp.]|uniref:LmeA family phospholipid-binding protein n=1 Tax=Mycolicibacterium sp. TaxID=2320850 RepID=UPI0028A94C12|nr:LmeA family phospholipid-binding protein [Mycolicibacterium sp.]